MTVRGGIRVSVVSIGVALALTGCSTPPQSGESVVRVPQDASLEEAGAQVADGGIVLIADGTYNGTLEIAADDVTVRGESRDGVVLDGELKASNGVVGTGRRVTVENLSVRNYLQNGVLITGVVDDSGAGVARGPDGYLPEDTPDPVPGYLVQRVTAQNNGLYGIYAFNRTGGIIRENLASGSPDSGIYVGQCADCNAVIDKNVVQWNAVGIELANASMVAITGNRVTENRIGVSALSNYLEAHGPSRAVQIAGNLITNNNRVETPEQASGAFGTGIGLGGTVDAEVRANLIAGNDNVGLWVNSSEDFAPQRNQVEANVWNKNALDVAYTPSDIAQGSANCFSLEGAATTDPVQLLEQGCNGGDIPTGTYEQEEAPSGIRFSVVPLPDMRPGLDDLNEKPRKLKDRVELPDVRKMTAPDEDYLKEPTP